MDSRFENFVESTIDNSFDSQSESEYESESSDNEVYDFIQIAEKTNKTAPPSHRIAVEYFDYDLYPEYLVKIFTDTLSNFKAGKIFRMTKYPTSSYMDRFHHDKHHVPKEFPVISSDEELEDQKQRDALRKANKSYYEAKLGFYITEIVFDSVKSAKNVYEFLNDVEIGDSGLRLSLRFMKDEEKLNIPKEFQQLIYKFNLLQTKSKPLHNKVCALHTKEDSYIYDKNKTADFAKLAFEDSDISDAENFVGGISESEAETEATDGEAPVESTVPKFKRCRRPKMDVNDYRALLGLEKKAEDIECSDESEEEMSLGEIDAEGPVFDATSHAYDERCVIDVSGKSKNKDGDSNDDMSESGSNADSENSDDEPKKKRKKINQQTKMRMKARENKQKKKTDFEDILSIIPKLAETDRYDELLYGLDSFYQPVEGEEIIFEHLKTRAKRLGITIQTTNFRLREIFELTVSEDEENENQKKVQKKKSKKGIEAQVNSKVSSDVVMEVEESSTKEKAQPSNDKPEVQKKIEEIVTGKDTKNTEEVIKSSISKKSKKRSANKEEIVKTKKRKLC